MFHRLALLWICTLFPGLSGAGDVTARMSFAFDGKQADDTCNFPEVSGNGRVLGFTSHATNLVAGDTNNRPDAFVRDLLTGGLERVSVSFDGKQANHGSGVESVSADGRSVVFGSSASNLVLGDTNGLHELFLRDLVLNATERVSIGNGGVQANGPSGSAAISADGRYVVFDSYATNLVEGGTNGKLQVFIRDRLFETTTLVSTDATGEQGDRDSSDPSISADGRYVVFESYARNLVEGDTNITGDVFIKDLATGGIERVSLGDSGQQGNGPSYNAFVTPDARYVLFNSTASNLVTGDTNNVVDTFVRDLLQRTTVRVSVRSDGGQGDHGGGLGCLTADGRYAVFGSASTNLTDDEDVNGRLGDVFMHDMQTGATWRISNSTSGQQGNDQSEAPSMSANGRFVAFASLATNLAPGDTNGKKDVFLHVNGGIGP